METAIAGNARPSESVARIEEITLPGVSLCDLAEHFHGLPGFALLHRQTPVRGPFGTFSVLSFAPFAQVTVRGGVTTVCEGGETRVYRENPVDTLGNLFARYAIVRPASVPGCPFIGGAIGYIAYEFGRYLESLPSTTANDLDLPECQLGFYNFGIVVDHDSGRMWLSYVESPNHGRGTSREDVWRELRQVLPGVFDRPQMSASPMEVEFTSSLAPDEYADAVRRIKDYIVAGDVYQVNMTLRFAAAIGSTSPWDIYRHLYRANPAPYAAYLNFDDRVVVSASPELFLRVRGRSVETRPIKGTIAAGADADADRVNRDTLIDSAKNRAELAMIVDLLRNDLGRVCRPGSVHVDAFPELESYPSLHHLVATISGTIRDGITTTDLLRATFPGGSITGAPKIRAMEIIDECEPVARGVYTGGIGYVGFDGTTELNIAIRTLVCAQGRAYIHSGSGIVADSVEQEEYRELLLKATRLFEAVRAVAQS